MSTAEKLCTCPHGTLAHVILVTGKTGNCAIAQHRTNRTDEESIIGNFKSALDTGFVSHSAQDQPRRVDAGSRLLSRGHGVTRARRKCSAKHSTHTSKVGSVDILSHKKKTQG